jgi:hypothetical protein
VNKDLVGKTITGIIASTERGNGVLEIWMLQLSDGTHVEFVSPAARRTLRRSIRRSRAVAANDQADPQLRLNVA